MFPKLGDGVAELVEPMLGIQTRYNATSAIHLACPAANVAASQPRGRIVVLKELATVRPSGRLRRPVKPMATPKTSIGGPLSFRPYR